MERSWRRVSEVGAVFNHDDVLEGRHLWGEALDAVSEGALDEERLQVGVVEEVTELFVDVAVVDVDPHGTDLEDRPEDLRPLDGVVGVDPNVVTGLNPEVGEGVAELVRAGLELGVGSSLAPGNERSSLGESIDGLFEEISEVEVHWRTIEH